MFDEAQRETLRTEINRILNEAVGALMDAGHLESGSVIVLAVRRARLRARASARAVCRN